jgi:hypothetical protein
MANESQVLQVSGAATDKAATAQVALVHADGTPAYILQHAGVPADGARATLARNPAGDDNALTFTAVEYGAGGNSISIAYIDPGAINQSLSVTVADKAITVSLATNGSGTITSTAAQVKAAIEANAVANALVTAAINTSDSGSADDGSGVVTALAAANMTGGAGFGVNVLGKGGLVADTTNGKLYINGGTLAAPVWKLVTSAS